MLSYKAACIRSYLNVNVQILESGQSRALACTARSANRVWGGPISDQVNGNGIRDSDG
jgi:hypothetical protein